MLLNIYFYCQVHKNRMNYLVICVLFVAGVSAHPQCLDFESPFSPAGEFTLCTEYRTFGCCANDTKVRLEYDLIIARISPHHQLQCSDFIKNILCQTCSPYAAHLYNAELTDGGPRGPHAFPSLCGDYMLQFIMKCGRVLPSLNVPLPLPNPDANYCYPDIVNDRRHTRKLGSIGISANENCIQLCVKEVANDIYTPVAATHANDGTHRFFVAEQRGVIWVYLKNFTRISPPLLDITASIYSSSRAYDERGLLDFVFHPRFVFNRLFYVLYSTRHNGKHVSRVSEFRVGHDMNRAIRRSERVVLDLEQPATNHNGGKLLFRENLLYVFTGDGGKAGDPFGNAQNKRSLLGKALRINVDRRSFNKSYGIPFDNPFVFEAGASPEVYAYGLRNPWRCSIDRGDPRTGAGAGRIFCADVGQNRYEEIDIISKGANYGWNGYEGHSCYKKNLCDVIQNHTPPISVYSHGEGKSITGGYVYRGCQSPNLNGMYMFADWDNGRMFYLRENGGRWTRGNICMGGDDICVNGGLTNKYVKYITSYAEDESGELYFLSTNFAGKFYQGGRIYKLVDPARRGNPLKCERRPARAVLVSRRSVLHPYEAVSKASLEVRLRGSLLPDRGRVELRKNGGAWGTICDDFWNRNAADVVCRLLGFARSQAAQRRAFYGRGTGPIHLDDVRCDGDEQSLLDCPNRGWDVNDCSHYEDASVICI